MSDTYNATVIEKQKLSDTLVVLKIKPDAGVPEFQSGQFAVLGLLLSANSVTVPLQKPADTTEDKLIRKAYSIASAPHEEQALEFYIALVPGGALTPRLFALEAGQRLFVGPRVSGKFTLDKIPADKHVLMIATGTGLAPFISMVRAHLLCGDARKFVILHGARHIHELGYFQELSLLSENCHNLIYIPCLTRPSETESWQGFRGRVTDALRKNIVQPRSQIELTPKNFEALLCGGPDMVDEVCKILEERGFRVADNTGGEIHKEEFW